MGQPNPPRLIAIGKWNWLEKLSPVDTDGRHVLSRIQRKTSIPNDAPQVGDPLVEPLETDRNRWHGIGEGILSEEELDLFPRR
jgi:hypothetical protein